MKAHMLMLPLLLSACGGSPEHREWDRQQEELRSILRTLYIVRFETEWSTVGTFARTSTADVEEVFECEKGGTVTVHTDGAVCLDRCRTADGYMDGTVLDNGTSLIFEDMVMDRNGDVVNGIIGSDGNTYTMNLRSADADGNERMTLDATLTFDDDFVGTGSIRLEEESETGIDIGCSFENVDFREWIKHQSDGDFASMSQSGCPQNWGDDVRIVAHLSHFNVADTERIHILLPGEDFPESASMQLRGEKTGAFETTRGTSVTVSAGREGVVVATTTCQPATDDYAFDIQWSNGDFLYCGYEFEDEPER